MAGNFGNTGKAKDVFLEIAKGNIPGHSAFLKFGENPDIDTASGFEDIWDAGGSYVPPTQARLHNIASTLAADAGTVVSSGTSTGGSLTSIIDSGATFQADGVAVADLLLNDANMEIGVVTAIPSETEITTAGSMRSANTGLLGTANGSGDAYRVATTASTGASVFYVIGLDASRLQIEEFVVLNGVSNVATSSSYVRQFRARAFGDGGSGGAEGTLTSTAQTDGTVSCQIIDGNNQTLMAIYTVPIGKIGYLNKWWGTLSKKQVAISVVRLRAGTIDGVGYILQARSIGSSGSSDFDYEYTVPLPIPGGVDVWVEADSNVNDLGVASGFDIVLVDDGF